MSTQEAEANAGPEPDRPLVLDELDERLDRFAALRKTDSAAADAVLDELGATGDIDRDIVLELSARRPLGRPERFVEAHILVMRALEVLDRNGARRVRTPGAGPLRPVAEFVVQLVTRFIVRSYQGQVIDSLRNLYTRRLAWAAIGEPERMMLARARLDCERATPTFKGKAVGVPTFLVGGAAVSSVGGALQGAIRAAEDSVVVGAVAVAVLVLGLAGASWAILRGAAVARRRIRLTLEEPLAALWETIGRCGRPPRDPARAIALYAIVLTFLTALVAPVGIVWIAAR